MNNFFGKLEQRQAVGSRDVYEQITHTIRNKQDAFLWCLTRRNVGELLKHLQLG